MDFSFSEQQQDVQNLARQILTEEVSAERQDVVDQQPDRFDKALWAKLAEAGLLGVSIAEKNGGMGFNFTELCFFIEEAGRTVAPIPVIPVLVSAALPIQQFGSVEQQRRLLQPLASGKTLITTAFMEPMGEDPATPLTQARPQGAGYVVNGVKTAVPLAHLSERVLISAKTDNGVVALMINPRAEGVTLVPLKVTSGEPQSEMRLENVLVATCDVLAGPEQGGELMTWAAQRTIVAYAAMQVGVSDKSMRMTASYTAERQQFGVPIATFQAVGHRAANCFIDVECLKLTAYQAASLLEADVDASTEVEIAKVWAGDVGHRVSFASQHLHGGIGIDKDYPLWRYCLWARHIELTLGSSASTLAKLGEKIAKGEAYVS
ncbi:alkylation response protein AidB-like acyl-CoA dehydrogenase [Sinobacterium caligoides]|uniref:Alkylation response protein AidB-like acyl-CoA dehydrogenase n=1 Tax=Sinobacterium caligoides TaxID=933926 RepID=A0A3N2E148_9GAMM|nr:acyl-CoA dehydrogenase family protein [Sinobacterium caligoides]ROS05295.1 alkylation response protein AidB-like acyl-CoA dehydrogenase [Sinobacterium caligoides]